MEPTLVAAIISLGISWLCLVKGISKNGWQWVLLIVGLFFFLSWLGNSQIYFGALGWIVSVVATVVIGMKYGKDRNDKTSH